MKRITLITLLLFATGSSFGQTENNRNQALTEEARLLTPLEPIEKNPAVFNSQAELDAKVAGKIDEIKQRILANTENAELVQQLRNDLWRMENAIVKPIKN